MLLGIGVYFALYKGYSKPPVRDIVSPLISLTVLLNFIGTEFTEHSLIFIVGLLLEVIADYYMNQETLSLPITIFGLSHAYKQVSFSCNFGYDELLLPKIISLTTCGICALLLSIIIVDNTVPQDHGRYPTIKMSVVIIPYVCIMGLTLFYLSLAQETVSYGFLLLGVSDLIIAADLIGIPVNRKIRVLMVPLLYWLSQYVLAQEFLSFCG